MSNTPSKKDVDDLVYALRQKGDDSTYALVVEAIAKWGTPQPAPVPPPEYKTEAEKRAFVSGWFKALKSERMEAANKKKGPL